MFKVLLSAECVVADEHYLVFEPTVADVHKHADELSDAYNDPHNCAMMGNTQQMSAADVSAYFADTTAAGARQFLLMHNGTWVGDADLRHVESGRAEFAGMIGPRALQGKGLGTRLAVMVHAIGFELLDLERTYVSILAENLVSPRWCTKIGYRLDDGAQARSYVGRDSDVAMSLEREHFRRVHDAELAGIQLGAKVIRTVRGT